MWHISTDTGGTFTDAFAVDPAGRESRCKVLSSGILRVRISLGELEGELLAEGLPDMPEGFYAGFKIQPSFSQVAAEIRDDRKHGGSTRTLTLDKAIQRQPAAETGLLADLSTGEEAPVVAARLLTQTSLGQNFPPLQLRLATTRATNALLERKGSPTAFFVSEGFGDLLRIGDQRRSALFALAHEQRAHFVSAVTEVAGRLDAGGNELEPLDEAAVLAQAQAWVARGIRHAAVALLHSYAGARHEQRVGELLIRAGFSHVSLSSQIAPFTKILPRAQSAVANAYLTGPVEAFIEGVATPLRQAFVHLDAETSSLLVLNSAGGLDTASTVKPKDLLLSGPAGGALGAANAAAALGHARILTLDMGGTSTDVARIDGRPGYRFSQNVAGMQLLAPCVAIETVAAGGGSICQWTAHGLTVGPESAGSHPGPACYGKGGPLTITDINLLLGRFDPSRAPIPLDSAASKKRLQELFTASTGFTDERHLLETCLELAVEHMADAIRRISVAEGYSPENYALLAFGGAGPQHACAVAARLGIHTILAPEHAGILSAVGLHQAQPERFAEKQVLQPLASCLEHADAWRQELVLQAMDEILRMGSFHEKEISWNETSLAELRLSGQDTPLQVPFEKAEDLPRLYQEAYQRLFGYPPPENRTVELVSLRVVVALGGLQTSSGSVDHAQIPLGPGPQLIQDAFSTLVVEEGWEAARVSGFGHVVTRLSPDTPAGVSKTASEGLSRDVIRHRLHSIVSDMGALLCRTAISTNIRERLDFSCALLDAKGRLVSSAPHIPVHLGALGVCVRETVRQFDLQPGDTLITNHPAWGGSHLPDVTLITPVFADDRSLLGYVANRAHHAEIGGITPGSMPAHATVLQQEGVVLSPRYLVRAGHSCFEEVASLLTHAPYPTRNLADNLADLHAQLAANLYGAERFKELAGTQAEKLRDHLDSILQHSASVLQERISRIQEGTATQSLDDGSQISVRVLRLQDNRLRLDFTGTSATHPHNLNATRAIVSSAALYVLRLLLQEDLPLNEGLLEPVDLVLPEGSLLNPHFSGDPARDPAVVGGNVEVSQRLVDTLIRAFGLQACSQGTMNNFLFGNARFGYYETLAGGTGAGPGYAGSDAVHSHMTNTAITDPEILEQRYPVRLRRFAIRHGSGGAGHWPGGCGVVREFEFLQPLTVSLLTQHRQSGPYGMEGGQDGKPGRQILTRGDGEPEILPSCTSFEVLPGDRVRIETPGGGGWGAD